jgi:hypothetical protein
MNCKAGTKWQLFYIHLQKPTIAEEALKTKVAFQQFKQSQTRSRSLWLMFVEHFMTDIKRIWSNIVESMLCCCRKKDEDFARTRMNPVDLCPTQMAQGY